MHLVQPYLFRTFLELISSSFFSFKSHPRNLMDQFANEYTFVAYSTCTCSMRIKIATLDASTFHLYIIKKMKLMWTLLEKFSFGTLPTFFFTINKA
jgi:hypothetical protein